jgi:hypothetical protein
MPRSWLPLLVTGVAFCQERPNAGELVGIAFAVLSIVLLVRFA